MSSSSPQIDVRDLRSVRRAASGIVLGDEYVSPETTLDREVVAHRRQRGWLALNRSPLARKIIVFNLMAIMILVCGVLYLNPSRDNLAYQRASGLVNEAELIADVIEARLPANAPVNLATGDGIDVPALLDSLDLRNGISATVLDPQAVVIATRAARADAAVSGLAPGHRGSVITDTLNNVWDWIGRLLSRPGNIPLNEAAATETAVTAAVGWGASVTSEYDSDGQIRFRVATPIMQNGRPVGVVMVLSAAGELESLIRGERELVLQMFLIGMVVSIGLSLVLASTIANPLSDLAAAAEAGRDRHTRKMGATRVRIPDLTARPDEIGRLSGALRGMVAALYERIESNEQFAADVAHEIKNPLASLRSAVGSLRVAKRDDQRERLLDVIEHDVIRLDRLVSDISNASRLDSDLVREEEQEFDLLRMLENLNEHLGKQARDKGVDYLTDLPPGPLRISGLEGRLAQVFVNLISNAISFCDEGDAIRVWARIRSNRVLVVVEDTGPGIPESALTKIFQRFYSERPEGQFGNNSGLGLAISKQIVEAHGGVIWAENIRPTDADVTSDPLGARFVVGLPL